MDRLDGRTDADGAVYMMVQKLPGPPGEECFVSWVHGLARLHLWWCSVEEGKNGRRKMIRKAKAKGRRKEEIGSR